MAHPVPAPIPSAPPSNLGPLLAPLTAADRQLLLDHIITLRTLPSGDLAVVYRGRGEMAVARGKTLAEAVANMRAALVSGYVVPAPAFVVTDAGRAALEREVCAWCEKPITDGQPSSTLADGSIAHAGECAAEFAEYERWTAALDAELAKVRPALPQGA